MQNKALLATLFIALATAIPSPTAEESAISPEATAEATNPATTSGGNDTVSTMASKTWQAGGGCRIKYGDVYTCLAQCIYEADYGPRRCPGWKHMTAVRTGGCVIPWYTCQCVCEY